MNKWRTRIDDRLLPAPERHPFHLVVGDRDRLGERHAIETEGAVIGAAGIRAARVNIFIRTVETIN